MAFGALLNVVNVGCFLLYILLENQIQAFSLAEQVDPYLYLIGIPLSYIYCIPHLQRIFQHLNAPSLWLCMTTALRMVLIMAGIYVFIYAILLQTELSRLFLFTYQPLLWIVNFVLIYYGPPLVSKIFFSGGGRSGAILFGDGPLPEQLRQYIGQARAMGVKFLGYYSDEKLQLPDIQWLGKREDLLKAEGGRKRVRTELVFAYTSNLGDPCFKDAIDRCVRAGARVNIYSDLSNLFTDPVRIMSDGSVQFFTFYDEPLQNPLNLFIKRSMDICVSLPVVLFILPPLTIMVWLMQRIQSPGPVLFKQTRYGVNRKPFTIYKYRTMHVHDRKLQGKQAKKGDSRIFPFGSFLRKSSLDEFPQFLNALMGTMSVVGPRPHYTNHDDVFEQYFRRYRSRHHVKPGITGLAQVSGYRGETTTQEDIIGRVRYDLIYISQWSVAKELEIFFRTVTQFIKPPKKAY